MHKSYNNPLIFANTVIKQTSKIYSYCIHYKGIFNFYYLPNHNSIFELNVLTCSFETGIRYTGLKTSHRCQNS